MTRIYFRRKISNIIIFVALIWVTTHFIGFFQKMQKLQEKELKIIRAITKYPGEMGKPVFAPLKLSKNEKELINQGWKLHKFNQFISDMIPINRSLPNIQDEWCKQPGLYRKNLPVTDVIICFHNEAWSTLIRTVHSVINRSPEHLIRKIILVDDFSSMDHLKAPLRKYITKLPKVILVRAHRRVGIIRARLLGMKHSKAPIWTYLDSHCECTEGWLEPLLDRIARKSSTVVMPYIDIINKDTFEYIAPSLMKTNFLGGFNWNLEYSWFYPSNKRKTLYKSEVEPHDTPTIAGGLFTIYRKFFQHLGTYDTDYEYWGAENLELSFKTWMCGGKLEMVYCSRVGHVFRNETPHNYPFADKVIIKNRVRLADTWLDDYANIFYESWGKAFNITDASGDVSDHKELRKNLGCESFKWYLENVYPEKFVPIAMGAIVHIETNLCLDADNKAGNVEVRQCHERGGNQFWMASDLHEIRKDGVCLSINETNLVLATCKEDLAKSHWLHDEWTHHISNNVTKQCLSLSLDRKKVLMENCRHNSWRQRGTLS